MHNPYIVTLRAYLSCWTLPISVAFLALTLVLSAFVKDRHSLGAWPLFPVLSFYLFVLLTLSDLTRQLLTTPAARLAPGFIRYHLTVAGAAGFGVWLLVSAVIAAVTSAAFVGAASVLLVSFAVIAWIVCGQGTLLFWIMVGAYVLDYNRSGGTFTALMHFDMPAVSGVLLAAGVAALIVIGKRLADLTEEHPVYHKAHLFSDDYETRQQDQQTRFWMKVGSNVRLEYTLPRPVKNLWQESRRLKYGLGAASALPSAFPLAAVLLLMVLIPHRPSYALVSSAPLLAATFWAVGLGGRWRHWRGFFAQELVRPVSRSRFFVEVGLAMLEDSIKTGAVLGGMVILIIATVTPGQLEFGSLVQMMILTVSFIPLMVGLCGLLICIRTEALFVLAAFIVGMAGLSLVASVTGYWAPGVLNIWPLISIVLLMAGAVACWLAHRVWMLADLG